MNFRLQRRGYRLLVPLLVTLVVSLVFLLRHGKDPLQNLNFVDSLSLSVLFHGESLIGRFKSSFNKRVDKVLRTKRKRDSEDKFWVLDTGTKLVQTMIEVPNYFIDPVSIRPPVGAFDPRFTLAVYYSHIARNPRTLHQDEVPFHWSDWLDMSVLNKYIFALDKSVVKCLDFDAREYQNKRWPKAEKTIHKGALDTTIFCRKEENSEDYGLGFVIENFYGRMQEKTAVLLGKAHLYSQAPNPYAILFLTKAGSYTVLVSRQPKKLLESELVDGYLKQNRMRRNINTLTELKRLRQKVRPALSEVMNDYEIHLSHEDFKYEGPEILASLKEKKVPGVLEIHHASYEQSLKESIDKDPSPPKYFYEASIFDTYQGLHYDWRFFNGLKLGTQEQANTLHRLVRTWLSFTRRNGLYTWMAHGSLLSWYWNGMAFPWDNDIDVQMPIMSFHKLSLKFNQTLIVEDTEEGFSRFFLDCGTFISTRSHSNGKNNIDARFIDVDTGLYIDITGIAITDDKTPTKYLDGLPKGFKIDDHSNKKINEELQAYNCRNRHFLSLTEVSPLIKTYVEGEVAYVPKRYSDILSDLYKDKGMLQKYFSGRLYIPNLRLWVHQDRLLFFMRHRDQWNSFYGSSKHEKEVLTMPKTEGKLRTQEVQVILGLSDDDFLELLQADDLLIDYVLTRELTAIHELEIMRLLFGKTTKDIVQKAPEFKPLMYDPYLYKANRDYITFEGKVQNIKLLDSKMKAAPLMKTGSDANSHVDDKNTDKNTSDSESKQEKNVTPKKAETTDPKPEDSKASDEEKNLGDSSKAESLKANANNRDSNDNLRGPEQQKQPEEEQRNGGNDAQKETNGLKDKLSEDKNQAVNDESSGESRMAQEKLEQGQPEQAKPEQAKPEEAKPEEAKPEQATPEQAKPEQANREAVKDGKDTSFKEKLESQQLDSGNLERAEGNGQNTEIEKASDKKKDESGDNPVNENSDNKAAQQLEEKTDPKPGND